jgi:hypothetical protein
MEDFLQKLYEKHVPAPVRDYIESREPAEPEATRRPSRPAAPARPQNHSASGGE